MKRAAIVGVFLIAVVLAMPGCRRTLVKDEKTFSLEPTVPHVIFVPACKKFEVTFTTKDNVPVSAYLMSKADGDESLNAGSVKGKKMAMQENVSNGRVASPASEQKVEMAVVFVSNTKATVTAKINGE